MLKEKVMEKIQLGGSDLKVSRLTIGCWSFGGGEGSYWGAQNQADVDALVGAALDRGINFFDTAIGYNNGQSEASLGKALKGRRKEAIICNKMFIQDKELVKSYENTLRESLKRLDTDYVDIMMIHWPEKNVELFRENMEALISARKKGLVREIGVSNFGTGSLKMAHEMGVNVVINESGYNLMCRGIEKEILPYCIDKKIGILTYQPLMQGVLTGKYPKVADIPLSRRRTVHYAKMDNPDNLHGGPGANAEVESLLDGLKSLSAKTGHKSGALAIAWVNHKPGVTSIIVGCRNVEQLDENMKSFEIKLSSDVIKEMDDISKPLFDKVGDFLDIYRGTNDPRVW